MKTPDLYVYILKDGSFVVRKNPPEKNETPTWSAINCSPFTEVEKQLILSIVKGTKYVDDNYNGENGAMKSGHGWYLFWKNKDTEQCYQKFILGCLANDIDLEIIDWVTL